MLSYIFLGVILVTGNAFGVQICSSPDGYFQDGNSCDSYFECRDFRAVRKTCGNGLQFDVNAVWPRYPCGYTSPLNCDAGDSARNANAVGDPICVSANGYYRDGNSCDSYFDCRDRRAERKTCENGLHFDQNVAWPHYPCAYTSALNCDAGTSTPVPPTQPPATYAPTPIATWPPTTPAPATRPPFTFARNPIAAWPPTTPAPATRPPFTYAPTPIATWPPTTAAPATWPPFTYAPTPIATWSQTTPAPATWPPFTYAPTPIATWPQTTPAPATRPPFIYAPTPIATWPQTTAAPTQTPSTALSHYWPTAAPSTVKTYVPTQTPTTIAPGTIQGYNCQQPDGYFSVANKCDDYVKCENNVAVSETCPDGLHFNPQRKYPEYPCDYPDLVQCAAGLVAQIPVARNQCPNLNGHFPMSNGDCSKYIICEDGVDKVMPCPAGLVYNTNKSVCDWPINVPSCKSDIFEGFTCPATDSDLIENFRYKGSCTHFVACQKGYPRYLNCDGGLRYDETTRSCVDASNVKDCTA